MTVCCPTCGSEVERIDPAKAVAGVGLSVNESRLVYALLKSFGEYVPTERIEAALYYDRPDGGPLNVAQIVSVTAKNANRKLAAVGLTIQIVGHGNGGHGRRLTWAQKASAA